MFKIKNKKMTGTASSRGMSVFDVDIHRNQEWLRRRKLRLEQVRRQSNEIARALRQKVINEEKARLDEYDRISEAKFKDWKLEKIVELERKFRCALEEFGRGYQLAEEEPDPEEIMEDRYKVNLAKAQKRGEIAKQQELRRKKMAEEQKMSLIQRKKLVRKKEDLRSALIHSVPNRKHILDSQKEFEEKSHPERVPLTPLKKKPAGQKKENVEEFQKKEGKSKGRKKKVIAQKSCMCKQKTKTSELGPPKDSDTIWINLSEIQNSSTGDSCVRPTSTKSSLSNDRSQKEKPESVVEFYDFSSRYYRKSFREFPHLVQRIHPESEMLNANDLAKIEDEREQAEARKKMEADSISQERGMEALRREKITQDYNNLIAKLEELNKKEKILKAQQRNLPNFLHMTDERLSERLKTKQRLMDSKFESIYYEVMSHMPRAEPPRAKPFYRDGGGDFAESDDASSTRSSGPPARLKPNSPVTSEAEPCVESSTEGTTRKPKKTKRKRQLLLDIEKTLKEGRELREAVSRSRDSTSADGGGENGKEISNSDSEEVQASVVDVLPCKEEGKTMRCQESQTEDIKGGSLELKDLSKLGDDSLPASTSTSYKSPPSVIRSYRLRQFLEYLEGVTQVEDDGFIQKAPNRNRKVDKLLQDLFPRNSSDSKSGEKEEKSRASPTLEYYIEKLLNMSRECVADLSVSSENLSTPNITDLDIRELKAPESVHSCQGHTSGEDLIRKCRLDRANRLEETIRDWKLILGKCTENNSEGPSEPEDVPDCPQLELEREEAAGRGKPEELECVMYSPKLCSRYEEITKKCSERISELSNMLDKVRKDKEKLLSSTSGDSSLSLNKGEGNSEVDEEEEGEPLERCVDSGEERRGSLVDGFRNRFSLSKPRKETVSTTAVADSQSVEDLEESLESWPDVMDELLKRKILTSPFKWSDGEYSAELSPVSDTHTKPSSIETVIGNFRKEISKIKPSALSDSFPQPDSFLKSNSFEEMNQETFGNKKRASSRRSTAEAGLFQEESSMESINQALTTLGLNWAKSFLRKNEESRAISSSSNSEGKCSGDEADDFH